MWKNIKSWFGQSDPSNHNGGCAPKEHQYVKQEIYVFEGFPNDIPRVGVVALANGLLKDCCRVLGASGVDEVSANLIIHLASQNQKPNVLVQYYTRNNQVYVITYVQNNGYQKVQLYPKAGEVSGFTAIPQP